MPLESSSETGEFPGTWEPLYLADLWSLTACGQSGSSGWEMSQQSN